MIGRRHRETYAKLLQSEARNAELTEILKQEIEDREYFEHKYWELEHKDAVRQIEQHKPDRIRKLTEQYFKGLDNILGRGEEG
jgi:uncharacterized protein YutE (UPF0331/DUF86 family)